MSDGAAKDKRIAAATHDDHSTQNKIPRKENMADKQIAAAEATPDDDFPRKADEQIAAPTDYDFPYKPALIECLQRARDKYNWDPELLKVSADDFKRLPYEQRRKWIIAHFLLREFTNGFKEEYYHEMDEDEKDLFN